MKNAITDVTLLLFLTARTAPPATAITNRTCVSECRRFNAGVKV